MSISIIHLTDIHLKSKKSDNLIFLKQDALYNAFQSVLCNKDKVVIIISGDIAFSGKTTEYENAIDLIEYIKGKLKEKLNINAQVLCVPGNHDCNFSKDQSLRNRLLLSFDQSNSVDHDTLLAITSVQKEYYDFASLYFSNKTDDLCNKVELKLGNKNFLFLLFNSAWMSRLKEMPGKLFFPDSVYRNLESRKYDCVISVMHHPYNWLHPNSSIEFINYIRQTTDILLLGHEHNKDEYQSIGTDWSLIECHGKELQNGIDNNSAFSIYQFDEELQNITTYDFLWNDINNIYECNEYTNMYRRNLLVESMTLLPSEKFMQHIEDPGITIHHIHAENIALSEIFCWPVLELLELQEGTSIKVGSKISSGIPERMLDTDISVIFGESLSGRTSLAKMLFKEYYSYESCCIICNGENLTTTVEKNLKKLIDKKFVEEYNECGINQFKQLDRNKKILIIDDFDNIPYHDERRSKVLSILSNIFAHIIILTDCNWAMQLVYSQMDDIENIHINVYQIHPFGNVKRKELVKKWYCLRDEYASGSREVEEKINKTCEKINGLLGSNGGIIPATPIYLINILQNLNSTAPASFSGSQYGFLYESLINKSLSTIAKQYQNTGEINIDIGVLSTLAFDMLKKNNNLFTYEDLQEIAYKFVTKKKVFVSPENILNRMFIAKIIVKVDSNTYKFRYPYIFYYFSGRYLAYNLTENDVILQIRYMCDRLYNEKYGNIIIFLCHFANNIDIIDYITILALTSLENYKPFDFNSHIDIFSRAQTIIEDLLVPVNIGTDSNIEENRQEDLAAMDEIGIQDGSVHEAKDITDTEAAREKDLASISAAMRTMDVLGQIIRNYPGDIDGELKIQIIDEIHDLGMRITEAMLSTIELLERDLITYIIDRIKDKSSNNARDDLIIKTKSIFSALIAGMIRGMISKIAMSLNNETLLMAIQEAFSKSDVISQKLVIQELKFNILKKPDFLDAMALLNKFDTSKNMGFASTILRSIVANYLRYNYCDHKMRDKLCAKFNLSSHSILVEKSKNISQL